ncbi:HpcH/HpaI aldolase family protein [Acetomicrobium sp.]|jgi:4-hydroxy-2-oxoheptanedioate aldolase|uniref:HpcH/HpaI aldolase family protein n=1 Tax=Acetomicrobium sp. TaxID=1872099 RepID=UPI002B258F6C|nr:aldolase/citrate lyase family protein [Acetomicrobium sp.]
MFSLKRRISNKETLLGTFAILPSTDSVEILALGGFDFVVLDREHGPHSIEKLQDMVRVASLHKMGTLVRVPENSKKEILWALDVGADGVLVPMVETASDAIRAVRSAKYDPIGERGVAFTRSSKYGGHELTSYFEESNENTFITLQCENIKGLTNLEEIANTPGVDMIFFGPFDMSASLGIPGKVEDPRVKEAAMKLLQICKNAGKAAGTFASTAEEALNRIREGFNLVGLGIEATIYLNAVKSLVTSVKNKMLK